MGARAILSSATSVDFSSPTGIDSVTSRQTDNNKITEADEVSPPTATHLDLYLAGVSRAFVGV